MMMAELTRDERVVANELLKLWCDIERLCVLRYSFLLGSFLVGMFDKYSHEPRLQASQDCEYEFPIMLSLGVFQVRKVLEEFLVSLSSSMTDSRMNSLYFATVNEVTAARSRTFFRSAIMSSIKVRVQSSKPGKYFWPTSIIPISL